MSESSRQPLPRVPLTTVGVCWLLLVGTLLLPAIPLDGALAVAAVRVADAGSVYVVPFLALGVIVLLTSRGGLPPRRRAFEFFALAGLLMVLLGGGSLFNEHLLKPVLGVARPNAVALEESGTLGTSIESYYSMSSKSERSTYLKEILENPEFTGEKMAPVVRDHWIAESGYSLPSGHTLSAFTLLTFALLATKETAGNVHYAVACLLVPWALAVSYSRVLLRVHWPNDVIVSGMAGILLGIGLFTLSRRLLWAERPNSVDSSANAVG